MLSFRRNVFDSGGKEVGDRGQAIGVRKQISNIKFGKALAKVTGLS